MSDFSQEELAQLLSVFRDEMTQLVDELGVHIETTGSPSRDHREEAFVASMRIAHNIKGAACTVGVESVEILAHAMEDYLAAARRSGQVPPDQFFHSMEMALSLMQQLVTGQEPARELENLLQDFSQGTQRVLAEVNAALEQAQPACQPEMASSRDKQPERVESVANISSREEEKVKGTESGSGSSVRVETRRLDSLMAQVGELLAAQARLVARYEGLEKFYLALRDTVKELQQQQGESLKALMQMPAQLGEMVAQERKELSRFGNIVDGISSAMKRVRMMPLQESAPHWRQVVREVALERDKAVRLEVDVGSVELDRHILEQLRDPMMHLLRNAVDHGIEPPEVRVAAGKHREGRIRITATLQGTLARLELSDDGCGLSVDQLSRVALEKGVIDANRLQSMTEEDILSLIFTDGFSTHGDVDRISGRGVGLAVVRKRIEALGGTAGVASPEWGMGTIFVMTVPVSVLSTKGLLVEAGAASYVVPTVHIGRILWLDRDKLDEREGLVYHVDGEEPLPLVWLSDVMGVPSPEALQSRLMVIVLAWEKSKLGLVVREIVGEREYVIKPLPWNLQSAGCVGGAVILADGSLALAVDVVALVKTAASRSRSGEAVWNLRQRRLQRRRVLVVDDSLTARVAAQNTLVGAGYEVALAIDGEQAWTLLQEESFDLVVSDVQMPGVDGFELTRRIRRDQGTRHLPVILLTNLGTEVDVAAGAAAGANEYIVKGKLEQQKLLDAVARFG